LPLAASIIMISHGRQPLILHFSSTLPTSVKNRYWLAVKMIAYTGFGFGMPFYAVHWHL